MNGRTASFARRATRSLAWGVMSALLCTAAAADRHVVLITIDGFPASMFWDAKTPIPRIRQLAAEGVVAEGLRIANPTVTWPNHTTLVTGVRADKHSVLFNGILVRGGPGLPVSVDPQHDKTDLVALPTVFDVLHNQGFRTAAIDWPCTRNVESLDDNFPDVPDPLRHTTPRLRQELVAQRILGDAGDAAFSALSGPARDEVWTQTACWVIRQRKPHLLLLHLLNTDSIHHWYGPQSPASYTALALADRYVGQVLDALAAAGLRGTTTVIVTADHGFASVTNVLRPNVLLRRAGFVQLNASNQTTQARAQVIAEGGTGMVYLTNPETREADREKVLGIFRDKEGIAEIVQPGQYSALGLPSPEINRDMADLVLVAQDGYAISGTATGEAYVVPAGPQSNLGSHGYLANNSKMNAVFVAAGRGLRHGGKIGLIDNVDVASTIAHLLGQKLPGADGKLLTEILKESD